MKRFTSLTPTKNRLPRQKLAQINPTTERSIPLNRGADSVMDEDGPEGSVFSFNRHLYFHGPIDRKSHFELKQAITALVVSTRQEEFSHLAASDPLFRVDHRFLDCPPVFLHLDSPGGDLLAGLALADFIRTIRNPDIHCLVEGEASSAASLLACVCSKRYIYPSAIMRIHQLRGTITGNYAEVNDEWVNCQNSQEKMVKIYHQFTNMTLAQIRRYLKQEREWDAQTCLKMGLVDEIIDPK
jgi:ATP-dependent protease ClpP protease subunit